MRTLLKRILFFLTLIFLGCQNEPVIDVTDLNVESVNKDLEQGTQNPSGTVNYVTGEDVPQIVEDLARRTGTGKIDASAKTLFFNGAFIDLSHIIKTENHKNGSNYSLAMDMSGSNKNHMYNLIYNLDDSGNLADPFIIRYDFEKGDLESFWETNDNYRYFKAGYKIMPFTGFSTAFLAGDTSKASECDSGYIGGGGDPLNNTPPGGSFVHTFEGTTVTTNFNNIPTTQAYSYNMSITSSDGRTNTVATVAQSQGITITTGGISAPLLTDPAQVNVSVGGGQNSGGGDPCIISVVNGPDGSLDVHYSPGCMPPGGQLKTTAYSTGCPTDTGAIGINTLYKSVAKLNYYLQPLGGLTEFQVDWFNKNPSIAYSINQFMLDNGRSSNSLKSGYAASQAYPQGFPVVSMAPLVKYPKGSNYASQYKKLTEYLKNQLPTLANNTAIVNAFKKYTNATTAQIEQILAWGNGPEIHIEQLGGNTQAAFETPNKIILDLDLVNFLENSVSGTQYSETVLFAVGVAVLHEAVHYGDFTYNNNYWQGRNDCLDGEEGWLFEESAYGTNVGILTDGTIYFFDRCD